MFFRIMKCRLDFIVGNTYKKARFTFHVVTRVYDINESYMSRSRIQTQNLLLYLWNFLFLSDNFVWYFSLEKYIFRNLCVEY